MPAASLDKRIPDRRRAAEHGVGAGEGRSPFVDALVWPGVAPAIAAVLRVDATASRRHGPWR